VGPLAIYISVVVALIALSITVWILRHTPTRKCHLCGAQVEIGRRRCQVCGYEFAN
jgi:transposase